MNCRAGSPKGCQPLFVNVFGAKPAGFRALQCLLRCRGRRDGGMARYDRSVRDGRLYNKAVDETARRSKAADRGRACPEFVEGNAAATIAGDSSARREARPPKGSKETLRALRALAASAGR
jgi:hypothetical protein